MGAQLRLAAFGAALALSSLLPAHALETDALFAWDEFNARRYTILNCHPGQTAEDQAYLAKGDTLERAAFDELKGQLDKTNPSQVEANAKAAEDMMAYRRKLREFSISEQIRNYGCDWLDDQFKLANQ